MPDAQCTRSLVCKGRKHTSSHHRLTGGVRHSLRVGFTAYSALSPVTGLFCHRHRVNTSTRLDASVGASGPHGFAVRNKRFRPARCRAPDAVASTASHPNDRDDHDAPLSRGETARIEGDLPLLNSALFCGGGLDRPNHIEFARQNGMLTHRMALPISLECDLGFAKSRAWGKVGGAQKMTPRPAHMLC